MPPQETLFVLSNDDAGSQEPQLFAQLLDFLAAQQVPATFFVVPAAGGKTLDQKPEWINLLKRAQDEGHELQLHGYNHGVFEFGVPPGFMLDIIPDAKARWQQEPDVVQAQHTHAALTDLIARGAEVLNRALGLEPQGFRSGCLAICDEMYRALAGLGFRWSSNQVVNPMGWRYINRDYEAGEPWDADIPPHPFRHPSGLFELPILSEYTWYLKPEDEERHYRLIRSDFDRVCAAGGAFVALSHYYAMTGQWSTALRLYERLFAHARESGKARFATLGQLYARYASDK